MNQILDIYMYIYINKFVLNNVDNLHIITFLN